MGGKNWLGAIYLRNGGYEIVLRSLSHYRRRLCTLGRSPELDGAAAMFASVLNSQAAKTVPEIDRVTQVVLDYLAGDAADLAGDAGFLDKALACYESDIRKAQDTGHEYFVGLVGDMTQAESALDAIAQARDGLLKYD
ncbi:MAG: hypothetical protein EB830_01605 [Nitrosopumilus sp. H13]|nr:MAG: hypothetical protein EB830_01605 [Nitrosopumilus sp. H13]